MSLASLTPDARGETANALYVFALPD